MHLEEKVNAFNSKYDKQKLSEIFGINCNNGYHQIEYELERIKVSNDQFQRRLSDIQQYKSTITPNRNADGIKHRDKEWTSNNSFSLDIAQFYCSLQMETSFFAVIFS